MKKTILASLMGLALLLTACTQVPMANLNQDSGHLEDKKESLHYTGSQFALDYPSYLQVKSSRSGARTTVSFTGTKPGYEVESLLSVSTMPNQGGLTLAEYSQEFIRQSAYIKSGELSISGVLGYKLILPESGAGPRYLFISENGQTIYDVIIQNFDSVDAKAIVMSVEI